MRRRMPARWTRHRPGPRPLSRLDAVWDAFYSYNGSIPPEHDRLADGDWPPAAAPVAERAEGPASFRKIDAAQSPAPAAGTSRPPLARPQKVVPGGP